MEDKEVEVSIKAAGGTTIIDGTSMSQGTTSTSNWSKKRLIALNPCWFCCIRGCNLRKNCIAIGIIEIVLWVIIMMIAIIYEASVEIETGASGVKYPHSEFFTVFIVCLIIIIVASTMAGGILLLAVRWRKPILCIIHTCMSGFIALALIVLTVNDVISHNVFPILAIIFLIILYIYFGVCSYGLYTQIRTGLDIGLHYPHRRRQQKQQSTKKSNNSNKVQPSSITIPGPGPGPDPEPDKNNTVKDDVATN